MNGRPKIAQMSRTGSGRKQVISWMDAPDDVYFRATDGTKWVNTGRYMQPISMPLQIEKKCIEKTRYPQISSIKTNQKPFKTPSFPACSGDRGRFYRSPIYGDQPESRGAHWIQPIMQLLPRHYNSPACRHNYRCKQCQLQIPPELQPKQVRFDSNFFPSEFACSRNSAHELAPRFMHQIPHCQFLNHPQPKQFHQTNRNHPN